MVDRVTAIKIIHKIIDIFFSNDKINNNIEFYTH